MMLGCLPHINVISGSSELVMKSQPPSCIIHWTLELNKYGMGPKLAVKLPRTAYHILYLYGIILVGDA